MTTGSDIWELKHAMIALDSIRRAREELLFAMGHINTMYYWTSEYRDRVNRLVYRLEKEGGIMDDLTALYEDMVKVLLHDPDCARMRILNEEKRERS